MPGYVIDQAAQKNFVMPEEATLDNIMEKTFWGFKLNPETGDFTAEEVDSGADIQSPVYEDNTNVNEYATWFWTKKNLNFSWNTNKPGHLIMEVF